MTHNQSDVAGPWPDPPIPDLDSEGIMHPPWAKYPNLPRSSMGWRMGAGESYLESFDTWWSQQSSPVRLAARAKYPEPQEWSRFWKSQFGV
jgi:hypothetical protein